MTDSGIRGFVCAHSRVVGALICVRNRFLHYELKSRGIAGVTHVRGTTMSNASMRCVRRTHIQQVFKTQ